MRFDAEWIRELLEGAPGRDELASKLTACGFNVEVREPDGDSEIWDVDVTTNRPDAMNHRGLAREAAVACGARLKPLEPGLEESGEAASDLVSVEIEAPELCGRYVARVVRGVRMAESPQWLAQRLERCGIRPINAIVDATNYVLMELGQPLHAFDLARVAGRRIVVRRAGQGETLTTLDGEKRALDPSHLVIADETHALALAGIMGGADSEIGGDTADVLIESAYFDPLTIRRGARTLGMHTEASHRFERGADPEMAPVAADVAAALIARLAGGTVCSGRVDVNPRPFRSAALELDTEKLGAFAGLEISVDESVRILEGLGFAPRVENGLVHVHVPSWRVDIERVQDLYEEIIRHVGYDAVPARLPVLPAVPGQRRGHWPLVDRARDAAVSVGLAEVVTYSFISPEQDEAASALPLVTAGPVTLDNPLARTQAIMRRSLLPGLAAAARLNLNQGETDLALFEEGRVFVLADGKPAEGERLGILLSGRTGPWDRREAVSFGDLKGLVEAIVERTGFPALTWKRDAAGALDEAEGAVLLGPGGRPAGYAGLLGTQVASKWELRQPVYVAELDLDRALAEVPLPHFHDLPRFPAVIADMTVEHPASLAYADLEAAVGRLASPLVERVELVVRYSGKGIEPGSVRTTLRVVYRHRERSLTQDEVNAEQEALRGRLASELNVRFA
ncbi:MAG: phenylalanine--tRNA ligase subunit beta [Acidobacteria bacterium]|nr:phenylalanine--tRNA ligase subunit beta [Acidobacteriota bacterium]